MDPLVSILIPAYNAERYISETIKSALAQTWARKEIIIVDDGSRDDTVQIARQFSSPTVSVVTQPNSGASVARNKAFSLCQGDFIQWLDADDLLATQKLSNQIRAWQQNPGKRDLLSTGWGYFVCRRKKAQFTPSSLWRDLSPAEWLHLKFTTNHFMQTSVWLVSRELTNAAGPWNERLTLDDDGEYFCRVVLASERVRFIPGNNVFYRKGASSLSVIGHSNKKMESQLLSIRLQADHLRSFDHTMKAAMVKYLQSYMILFYPNRPDLVKEAEEIATSLGGKLQVPSLPGKYALIQKVFGWQTAKSLQIQGNRLKANLIEAWDRALFAMQSRNSDHAA
jgi:glycosyltransferase involved in cell wall biosynthesis